MVYFITLWSLVLGRIPLRIFPKMSSWKPSVILGRVQTGICRIPGAIPPAIWFTRWETIWNLRWDPKRDWWDPMWDLMWDVPWSQVGSYLGSHMGCSIILGGIPNGMFHNPGWDPTWKRRDPTWDTPGIPGGNGEIPPHIYTWVTTSSL